jgi:hypothetical protein
MTRFRPTVEVLDARTLPSAVLAGHDAPTAGQPTGEVVAEMTVSRPVDESTAPEYPPPPRR